jgi:hypothetical protein
VLLMAGDPKNNPSTYKEGWDVPLSESYLSTLCAWLWHAPLVG